MRLFSMLLLSVVCSKVVALEVVNMHLLGWSNEEGSEYADRFAKQLQQRYPFEYLSLPILRGIDYLRSGNGDCVLIGNPGLIAKYGAPVEDMIVSLPIGEVGWVIINRKSSPEINHPDHYIEQKIGYVEGVKTEVILPEHMAINAVSLPVVSEIQLINMIQLMRFDYGLISVTGAKSLVGQFDDIHFNLDYVLGADRGPRMLNCNKSPEAEELIRHANELINDLATSSE